MRIETVKSAHRTRRLRGGVLPLVSWAVVPNKGAVIGERDVESCEGRGR